MIGISSIRIWEILDDKNLFEELRKYAEEQYACENIEFIYALKNYKTMTNNNRKDYAIKIYETFVEEDAPYALGCVTLENRKRVEDTLHLYQATLFDEIEQCVILDVRISILPGFINSIQSNNNNDNSSLCDRNDENDTNNGQNTKSFGIFDCLSVKN
eukprot:TRINITY_DN1894_c0_g1_i1.p1 TRINITY_DN1894_c0_g1~~TRINITY_DN1894_c0_g1_i1.p1  ORF type:complete len:158 (-),score=37.65 TRINITY_DN1894_c0_g1_i1:119-592(-)